MLYVCIPSYNEAVTVGVLLWRLRTTLREQAAGRDYEIVVYDDASTDATAEVLAPYARVLPLTVLRGGARVGQAAAVDALIRHVVGRSHAPDTDALLLMQADYTDAPDLVGEMLPLLEAGADIVLTRRGAAPEQSLAERRLRRSAPVLLSPLMRGAVRDGVARDPLALLSTMRVFRVAVLRDALAALGAAPLVRAPGWAGTAELVVRTAPFARRIERVEAPARYDVRVRPSRIEWTRELRAILALLWRTRTASHARGRPTVRGLVAPTPLPVPVAERVPDARPPAPPSSESRSPERPARKRAHAVERSPESRRDVPRIAAAEPTVSVDPVSTTIVSGDDVRADGARAEGARGDVEGVDAMSIDAGGASTPRPGRRRRRGRGRAGAVETTAASSPAPGEVPDAPDAPGAPAPPSAPTADARSTPSARPGRRARASGIESTGSLDVADNRAPDDESLVTAPAVAPASADGAGTASTKRRRRRGRARQRPQGPESDTGVSAENPDPSVTLPEGAPRDASSDHPSS